MRTIRARRHALAGGSADLRTIRAHRHALTGRSASLLLIRAHRHALVLAPGKPPADPLAMSVVE